MEVGGGRWEMSFWQRYSASDERTGLVSCVGFGKIVVEVGGEDR